MEIDRDREKEREGGRERGETTSGIAKIDTSGAWRGLKLWETREMAEK